MPDDVTYDEWAKGDLQMTADELGILSKKNRNQKYFAAWGFLDSHSRFLGAIAVDCKEREPYRDEIRDPAAIYQDTADNIVFLLTT